MILPHNTHPHWFSFSFLGTHEKSLAAPRPARAFAAALAEVPGTA